MRQDWQISNLSAGELSPRMKGRADFAKYYNGAESMLNMVVMPQGGATRRPGTMFVAANANQGAASVLIPFVFSTIQAYTIELGDGLARFYANSGQVTSGGSPVQISTPWTASELPRVTWTQSADTLYLFHPDHPPQLLTRTSATAFSIAPAVFLDGPYLTQNATSTTLTASATTGVVTITASSGFGINYTGANPGTGVGFKSSDVGRQIRIKTAGSWGWLVITAWTDSTHVQAQVQAAVPGGASYPLDGTAATTVWALGKWSNTTGFPYCGTFWQNRLLTGGNNVQPNAIEGSYTGSFLTFSASAADSSVTAANAMSWIISDDQVNAVAWITAVGSAQAAQLGIGTSGGENVLQAQTTSQALSPTNVQAYRETSFGAAPNIRPLRIGKALLFANRALRKIHEWTFSWQVNGYEGPDLTVLAEHITQGSIAGMVYQQSPHGVVWIWMTDGSLAGLTYLREQQVVGFHRHILGGQYYGGAPRIESAAVIPSPGGGQYDQLWLTVARTINGAILRSVEVMQPYFEAMPADQSWFLDCALATTLTTWTGTATVSGLTNTGPIDQPPQFTGTGILATSAAMLSPSSVNAVLRMNGGAAQIMSYIDSQHAVISVLPSRPFNSMAPSVAPAWTLTAPTATASGLTHLSGETVSVLADGQTVPPQVVTGGSVSTGSAGSASLILAGLNYTSLTVTMPLERDGGGGLGQGRLKRVDHLYIRFHETIGGAFGQRIRDPASAVETDRIEPIENRSAGDAMSSQTPLFSGIKRVPAPGGGAMDARVMVVQQDPLPLTILAIGAKGHIAETAGG